MFTVADPTGSVANNLASVRSSASVTFVGNWTTVVVERVQASSERREASSESSESSKEVALATTQQEFRSRERNSIGRFLPGDTQSGLTVQTDLDVGGSELILLPIHVLSYRYGDIKMRGKT